MLMGVLVVGDGCWMEVEVVEWGKLACGGDGNPLGPCPFINGSLHPAVDSPPTLTHILTSNPRRNSGFVRSSIASGQGHPQHLKARPITT